ncbi:phosphatidate cytidylyltransferase [Pseudodesulfovibrio sp. zrk46]|uniref:phosphatidate cytidylyltransferase n=1 Tax=Pseudodesulfovibrio sp. zrk46 TaxID=2725288 RepID=UPI001448B0F1|nr:phosphatidate cytidylyltransferase [Pseudodesulfovibrio sp. zrk46]QJB58110.1 phosphatidate cytidylyltransferase [Pseudodesulfovibrio sp. zrk46]
MDISQHQKRIATAAALAVIPALALIFQGWVLFTVLALFCCFTLWEFYDLFRSHQGIKTVKSLGTAFTFLLLGAFTTGDLFYPAVVLFFAFWTAAFIFLYRYSTDLTASFVQAMIFLTGLIYIPINFHFFLNFNRWECVLVIGAAAVSDTAAFYAGTMWGNKKIWPKVSPKKSWAGSIGGLTACTVLTTVYGLTFGHAALWQWVLLGAALNVAAQMGDFFESALKRSLDVKDSSHILPGHGGFLDRVDSMLLVVPLYGLLSTLHPFFK